MNLDTQVSNECTAIELPLNLDTQCIPPTAPHRAAPRRAHAHARPGPARRGERARACGTPVSFSNFTEGVH